MSLITKALGSGLTSKEKKKKEEKQRREGKQKAETIGSHYFSPVTKMLETGAGMVEGLMMPWTLPKSGNRKMLKDKYPNSSLHCVISFQCLPLANLMGNNTVMERRK